MSRSAKPKKTLFRNKRRITRSLWSDHPNARGEGECAQCAQRREGEAEGGSDGGRGGTR